MAECFEEFRRIQFIFKTCTTVTHNETEKTLKTSHVSKMLDIVCTCICVTCIHFIYTFSTCSTGKTCLYRTDLTSAKGDISFKISYVYEMFPV